MEEALRLVELTLDQTTDSVYWIDSNGGFVYVNPAACDTLGYSRDELLTMTVQDIDPNLPLDTWAKAWGELGEGRTLRRESCHRTKDGRSLPVELLVNRLEIDGREYNCFVVHEISGCNQGQKHVRGLNEEIELQVARRTSALLEEIEGRERIETALLDEKEKIQTILDNAGQGFLTFGPDLKIDLDCSEECRKLFDGEIWGRLFPELAFPNDDNQQEFLNSIFEDIFKNSDLGMHEIFLSLLPLEICINGKHVHAEYKEILPPGDSQERKLMVVLTDITETLQLRNQIEEERNLLRMVVKAVTSYNELVESARDYILFCQVQVSQILDSGKTTEDITYEIFRMIHTFKGMFSQLDFVYAVSRLHDLESQIRQLRAQPEKPTVDDIRKLMTTSGMEEWLEKDMRMLKDILGEKFFSREEVLDITPSQLADIEQIVMILLSPAENKQLLPKLRQLRYRSFKSLLRNYPEFIRCLSERLQKPVKPLVIEGDDITVDPDRYRDFTKSLVHVFRNMMDHGIESEVERAEAGKSEEGNIECRLRVEDSSIFLKISDDGNGIDVNRVREKAIEMGICNKGRAQGMSDDEIIELIFVDEMSTKDDTTDLSGRGIGLSAVKQELTRLGGQISIRTSPGEGTAYYFSLPIVDTANIPEVSPESVVRQVISRATELMRDEMELVVDDSKECKIVKTDKLMVEGIVVLINIKGSLSGMLVMTFEDKLAQCLVHRFAMDELTPEEAEEHISDAMAEIANIVLGNSLDVLPELSNWVTIATPTTIKAEGKHVLGFAGSDIWTSRIDTEKGYFTLSLLPSGNT